MKIANLDYDNWSAEQLAILGTYGKIVDASSWTQADLLQNISDYDGLFIGLSVRIDRAVIQRAEKLQFVVTATTGVDHLETEAMAERNIDLISLRGATDRLKNVTGTAELAMLLLLAVMRKLPMAHAQVVHGQWKTRANYGHELYGKTLGIIGYGRLGTWMANYGRAFQMPVLFYDPNVDPVELPQGIQKVDYPTILEQADIISLHPSLNPSSERMVDAAALAQMKDGVVLVNTARGAIVDTPALIDALLSGKVAGAGVDVFDDEKLFVDQENKLADHPLVRYAKTHDNLILTPHIGGSTLESSYKARAVVLELFEEYMSHAKG